MGFSTEAKLYIDPEDMAAAYLTNYYGDREIEYPINPFKMLRDEGILFSMMNFEKLEGVYIPAHSSDDIPVVGINVNRPITRQRFSAVHELCHHFRDADKQISCPIGSKNSAEKYAEAFAAAVLMPMDELIIQVEKYRDSKGDISFDDVLRIADYFGVSFEACLYRIAYRIHAISGNTEPECLKKRVGKYKPDQKRKQLNMTFVKLYADLIDCYTEQLGFIPSDYVRYCFQNEYIYNDSRIEGLNVSKDQASEIVTDLRLNMQNSKYCNDDNEAYLSVAGNYEMYQHIFTKPVEDNLDIYYLFTLHKYLFSYYPNPEYGGSSRSNNNVVTGAKVETVDYHDIFTELEKVNKEVKDYYSKRQEISLSEYIKHVVRIHHRITVIHPMADGNGRTSRAYMNTQLVRAGIIPIYIRIGDKKEYVDALARADELGDYDELYELIFKLIVKFSVELKGDLCSE